MGSRPVAVIGAGNVGCALAGDLSLRGCDVRLCNRSAPRLEAIRSAGGITVTGAVEGFAPVALVTTNVNDAVLGADVVAVTVPTPGLPYYAAALAESVSNDQVIWLDPGHSGGGLYLGAELRRSGRAPLICQLSTASHGSRMAGPATVGVFALPAATLAAFPSRDLAECHARVDALLPGQFGTTGTVLELDLQNVNAVMHPAQMVCNASWIEATGGDLFIYREGTGPATARIIEAVDSERMALANRLGVPTLSLVDSLARAGYTERIRTGGVYAALQAGEPIGRVKAPPTLDHRYLHEDVGWGIVQWVHLASVASVPTPTMEALTTLAGALNGLDYRRGSHARAHGAARHGRRRHRPLRSEWRAVRHDHHLPEWPKTGVLSMKAVLLSVACLSLLIGCRSSPAEETPSAKGPDTEAKLEELGIELPEPPKPVANYVGAVRTGNLLFMAGAGPLKEDGTYMTGRLGQDVTIDQGYQAARRTGIIQLASLKAELGDLNKVKRIVKVLGMVNSAPSFTDQPKVINGFSDLMAEVFGDRGKHARSAVGMAVLPFNIPVEVEMIVEVE